MHVAMPTKRNTCFDCWHEWAHYSSPELVPMHLDLEVNSNAETYQTLQARHQALQANLVEQAVSSTAIQQQLEQKLASAEEELQVVTAMMLPLLQWLLKPLSHLHSVSISCYLYVSGSISSSGIAHVTSHFRRCLSITQLACGECL